MIEENENIPAIELEEDVPEELLHRRRRRFQKKEVRNEESLWSFWKLPNAEALLIEKNVLLEKIWLKEYPKSKYWTKLNLRSALSLKEKNGQLLEDASTFLHNANLKDLIQSDYEVYYSDLYYQKLLMEWILQEVIEEVSKDVIFDVMQHMREALRSTVMSFIPGILNMDDNNERYYFATGRVALVAGSMQDIVLEKYSLPYRYGYGQRTKCHTGIDSQTSVGYFLPSAISTNLTHLLCIDNSSPVPEINKMDLLNSSVLKVEVPKKYIPVTIADPTEFYHEDQRILQLDYDKHLVPPKEVKMAGFDKKVLLKFGSITHISIPQQTRVDKYGNEWYYAIAGTSIGRLFIWKWSSTRHTAPSFHLPKTQPENKDAAANNASLSSPPDQNATSQKNISSASTSPNNKNNNNNSNDKAGLEFPDFIFLAKSKSASHGNDRGAISSIAYSDHYRHGHQVNTNQMSIDRIVTINQYHVIAIWNVEQVFMLAEEDEKEGAQNRGFWRYFQCFGNSNGANIKIITKEFQFNPEDITWNFQMHAKYFQQLSSENDPSSSAFAGLQFWKSNGPQSIWENMKQLKIIPRKVTAIAYVPFQNMGKIHPSIIVGTSDGYIMKFNIDYFLRHLNQAYPVELIDHEDRKREEEKQAEQDVEDNTHQLFNTSPSKENKANNDGTDTSSGWKVAAKKGKSSPSKKKKNLKTISEDKSDVTKKMKATKLQQKDEQKEAKAELIALLEQSSHKYNFIIQEYAFPKEILQDGCLLRQEEQAVPVSVDPTERRFVSTISSKRRAEEDIGGNKSGGKMGSSVEKSLLEGNKIFRELFIFHQSAIVFLEFIPFPSHGLPPPSVKSWLKDELNQEMLLISLDEEGYLAYWKYSSQYFQGIAWFEPWKIVQIKLQFEEYVTEKVFSDLEAQISGQKNKKSSKKIKSSEESKKNQFDLGAEILFPSEIQDMNKLKVQSIQDYVYPSTKQVINNEKKSSTGKAADVQKLFLYQPILISASSNGTNNPTDAMPGMPTWYKYAVTVPIAAAATSSKTTTAKASPSRHPPKRRWYRQIVYPVTYSLHIEHVVLSPDQLDLILILGKKEILYMNDTDILGNDKKKQNNPTKDQSIDEDVYITTVLIAEMQVYSPYIHISMNTEKKESFVDCQSGKIFAHSLHRFLWILTSTRIRVFIQSTGQEILLTSTASSVTNKNKTAAATTTTTVTDDEQVPFFEEINQQIKKHGYNKVLLAPKQNYLILYHSAYSLAHAKVTHVPAHHFLRGIPPPIIYELIWYDEAKQMLSIQRKIDHTEATDAMKTESSMEYLITKKQSKKISTSVMKGPKVLGKDEGVHGFIYRNPKILESVAMIPIVQSDQRGLPPDGLTLEQLKALDPTRRDIQSILTEMVDSIVQQEMEEKTRKKQLHDIYEGKLGYIAPTEWPVAVVKKEQAWHLSSLEKNEDESVKKDSDGTKKFYTDIRIEDILADDLSKWKSAGRNVHPQKLF